jgi:hypothetical protein
MIATNGDSVTATQATTEHHMHFYQPKINIDHRLKYRTGIALNFLISPARRAPSCRSTFRVSMGQLVEASFNFH